MLAVFLSIDSAAIGLADTAGAQISQGFVYLRTCLALFGAAVLIGSFLPGDWFQHPGLPYKVSGMYLGPEGWATGSERVSWVPLTLILLAGAVFRLIQLDADLWLDEIVAVVHYMRRPISENLYTFGGTVQHVLNSILGHISLTLLGENAWTIRLPAVFFGIAGLGALYYFARAVTTEREALLSTALLAANYHHIWFSQNARGYTAMIFWILLATGLLLRGLAQNSTRAWILYTMAMPFGVLSLLNSAFVFASHIPAYVLMLFRWPESKTGHWPLSRRIIISTLLGALLTVTAYSLMLPSMLRYFGRTASGIEMGWTNPLEFLSVVAHELASGLGILGLPALVVGFVIALVGWISYWRQCPLVNALLAFPLLFNVLALVVLKFGAYPRSFLYVLPLGLLLVVRGALVAGRWLADRLAPTRWQTIAVRYTGLSLVGLILLVSTVTIFHNYRFPKQNYTGALQYVEEHKDTHDVVSAVGWAAVSYRLYYAPALAFPDSLDELKALERESPAVWVIYSFSRDMRRFLPQLYDYIQEEYKLTATFPGTLADGHIYVAHRDSMNAAP